MKKINRFLLAVCCIAVALPAIIIKADIPIGEYITVSENENFSLSVNIESADIAVLDKKNGKTWYSIPHGIDGEGIDTDVLNRMKSQIRVIYVDSQLNEVTINSFDECVKNGDFEVRKITNGVRITYNFTDKATSFSIPIEAVINEDCFETKILYDKIFEKGSSRIHRIELLPYFGAGRSNEDGYLMIPDGSGAITRLNDNHSSQSYERKIYGDDPSINLLLKSDNASSTVKIPAFGIKRNSAAMLGIVTASDAEAYIIAQANGLFSEYSSVAAAFIYHQKDLTGIRDRQANQRMLLMVNEKPVKESPVVKYFFLRDGNANYNGMARICRQYYKSLIGKKSVKNTSSLYLEFYGKTQKDASVFGIPYKKRVVVNTTDDIKKIIESLESAGVSDITALMYSFGKNAYHTGFDKSFSIDNGLGGKKGYRSISEKTRKIYHMSDFTRAYNLRLNAFNKSNYVKSLNKVNVLRKEPLVTTGDWDDASAPWNYLSSKSLVSSVKKYISGFKKEKNQGIGLLGMGSELYSDFNSSSVTDRNQMLKAYKKAINCLQKENIPILSAGSNAYMAGLCDVMTEVPLSSGGYDIFSSDIPFYQLVFHGICNLATDSLNGIGTRTETLKIILETGVAPTYTLSANSTGLTDTPLNFLYNTKADVSLINEISKQNKIYNEICGDLSEVEIYSYEIKDGLAITTYENGCITVSNRSGIDREYNGKALPADGIIKIDG